MTFISVRPTPQLICTLLVMLSAFLWCQTPLAQETELPTYSPEFGLHFGPYLPAHIEGVDETLMAWGARFSTTGTYGTVELDNMNARSEGIVYNSTSLDFRISTHNPYLPAHMILGGHADWFKGKEKHSYRFAAGWHYGGGVMQELADPVWFRIDFKYRFSPGQSLYVGLGLIFRFRDGAAGN